MVNYNVVYEHTAGNTITFKSANLQVTYMRDKLEIVRQPDGNLKVVDPDIPYRIISCVAILSSTDMNTLDGWMMGTITYSGLYPRITVLYWDGSTTETNIEVAITNLQAKELGDGEWEVSVTFTEKDK